jgi:hypothetical protein
VNKFGLSINPPSLRDIRALSIMFSLSEDLDFKLVFAYSVLSVYTWSFAAHLVADSFDA